MLSLWCNMKCFISYEPLRKNEKTSCSFFIDASSYQWKNGKSASGYKARTLSLKITFQKRKQFKTLYFNPYETYEMVTK